jgi:hypothetical protein
METEHIGIQEVQDDPQARALLEAAAAQNYKLPLGFAGFQADLMVQIDEQTSHGRVTGYTPRHITVTLPDTAAHAWAERELQSILGHRWPTPFAERDGRYTLTLDTTYHPLGVRINLHGDPLQSYYRVCDDRITQVYRVMGDQKFTISILDVHILPDGRHLSKHFTVVFQDQAGGSIARSAAYTDRYVAVSNCWLPALRRVIVTDAHEAHTYVLELSNHRLMDEEGTATPLTAYTQPGIRL